jgi:CRISPR-associated exonuclease Cas4
MHERADEGHPESRGGARVLRAVRLACEAQGLHGVADVVEMRGEAPYPVEYKRGRPKAHRADEVQLCAQALCLEEMTGRAVPEGALFYGRTRRRKVVAMDAELRTLTLSVAAEAREALDAGTLPPPVHDPRRCGACSLVELCRPEAPRDPGPAWMARRLSRAGVPD